MKYGEEKYGLLYNRWVLFGVRGISSEEGSVNLNNDAINEYNDALFLIRNLNGSLECKTYVCTIDPGRYWLNHPMNPNGTARIAEGVYKYTLGIHRGHKALTQYAKVTVNRYAIHGAGKPWFQWKSESPSMKDTGFFAIDIHAKSSTSKYVEMASAGCTVLNSTWTDEPWKEFYSIVDEAISSRLQPYLCYCVLNQDSARPLIDAAT
ncbi:hypothetical protein [Leptospira langatensis]|nr:hypothetical protein [Leptospira langatensis]TGK04161.1 hypothetical protein EHO57_03385 [Leptospira langatensis]